ncbi:MAG: hypothetical protein WD080_00600 [Egibacteraceae bacterium]
MQRKPAVDTALYLPDHLLEIYQEDAARQVVDSWATRPVRTAPPSPAGLVEQAPDGAQPRTRDTMLTVAAILALLGWTACTGWWTWLAIDTGATMWTAFAGVGIASLVIGTILALRFLIADSRARPAHPQTEAPQTG